MLATAADGLSSFGLELLDDLFRLRMNLWTAGWEVLRGPKDYLNVMKGAHHGAKSFDGDFEAATNPG